VGDYFNNILEKCSLTDILFILSSQRMRMSHQVAKFIFEGDKCPLEGMRYVLLALVCFGGRNLLFCNHSRNFPLQMSLCLIVSSCLVYPCSWEKSCFVEYVGCQAHMLLKKIVSMTVG
jgi:hypothetical protein